MEGTEDQCAIRRHDADKPSRILYHEGIRHASEFCRLADGENDWCREGESNPHSPFGPADFKSAASANFAIPARVNSSLEMLPGDYLDEGSAGLQVMRERQSRRGLCPRAGWLAACASPRGTVLPSATRHRTTEVIGHPR